MTGPPVAVLLHISESCCHITLVSVIVLRYCFVIDSSILFKSVLARIARRVNFADVPTLRDDLSMTIAYTMFHRSCLVSLIDFVQKWVGVKPTYHRLSYSKISNSQRHRSSSISFFSFISLFFNSDQLHAEWLNVYGRRDRIFFFSVLSFLLLLL